MSQQTIKQQARRTAREMAEKRPQERAKREARTIDLAEQVMVAVGERDVAVAETEKRAGAALRELTEVEGLSLGEAVEWCGDTLTVREAVIRGAAYGIDHAGLTSQDLIAEMVGRADDFRTAVDIGTNGSRLCARAPDTRSAAKS